MIKGIVVPHHILMKDPRVLPLVQDLRKISTNREEYIQNAFNLVRSRVQYVEDKNNQGMYEYVQMPMETLNLGKGDCEDMSILLMSLLWGGGVFESREALGYVTESHRWVEVLTPQGWMVLDATNGDAFPVSMRREKGYKPMWFITPLTVQSEFIPSPPIPLLL